MRILYAAFDEAFAAVTGSGQAKLSLKGRRPQCLGCDPEHPQIVYCGTFDDGLWRSEDGGSSWARVRLPAARVTALTVGPNGLVYVGSEPSALFRSYDFGLSFHELSGLKKLPSASNWSFPPRPQTSHVRWIALDPQAQGELFVAIEAGALVYSHDGGDSWQDRRPEAPRDSHQLVILPGRLYSAAGDGFRQPGRGFARSDDRGQSWSYPCQGLEHHYLWSLAADPGDPETILVSAAAGPRQAHDLGQASSRVYRRTSDSLWQAVGTGLPQDRGTLATVLSSSGPGVFYAGNNRGLFGSEDAGQSWHSLRAPGPELGRVHGLLVIN